MTKIYAMYKGEQCLAIGSLVKLAHLFNVKYRTMTFYLTPTYKKRIQGKKNRRELILVDTIGE